MAGSMLKVNNPDIAKQHDSLKGRNSPAQHSLEAIYRSADGKNLATILTELASDENAVLWDMIIIMEDNQTLVSWNSFEYDLTRDVLFVSLCGTDVYEGTDKDFVKTSPNSITFNYPLHIGYEVFIVLAGTISTVSFGDDIYNALSRFTQLTDTPQSYYGRSGMVVTVNDSETGLVLRPIETHKEYISIEDTLTLEQDEALEKWLDFVHNGSIQSIKVTPLDTNNRTFVLSIWNDLEKTDWVYHSGEMYDILYDIMNIPHVDVTGQDKVYIRLFNNGPECQFKVKIMILV